MPADLLWFDVSPVRATVEEPDQDKESAVRRRELFTTAGVTVGSELLANTPWQRLMDSVDKGRPVDAATAQLIQDRTADFFDTEETVPARQVIESLTRHRTILVSLLGNAHTDAVRHQLTVSMGETDTLVGWLHFDLGHANEAVNAWRSTLKIARKTGDGALAACTLGYWSYLAAPAMTSRRPSDCCNRPRSTYRAAPRPLPAPGFQPAKLRSWPVSVTKPELCARWSAHLPRSTLPARAASVVGQRSSLRIGSVA